MDRVITARDLLHPDTHSDDVVSFVQDRLDSGEFDKPIPPDDNFYDKRLVVARGSEYKWMVECKMILVTKGDLDPKFSEKVDHLVVRDLEFLYRLICKSAVEIGPEVIPGLDGKRKLVAIDTETNGLDVTFRLVGGKMVHNSKLVGLVVAVSSRVGYYIPIANTGIDGVKNWSREEVLQFLAKIVSKDFHLLLFNALFDFWVLRLYGVDIPRDTDLSFTDLQQINMLMNNWEFTKRMVFNNLKDLSKEWAGRKMIDIKELTSRVGAEEDEDSEEDKSSKAPKGKKVAAADDEFLDRKEAKRKKKKSEDESIRFDLLPAVNSAIYAVSDTLNTYYLFESWVIRDQCGRNPYKHQLMATFIDHATILEHSFTLASGMPVNYQRVRAMLLTTIRRMFLLSDLFDQWAETTDGVIASNERTNRIIGEFIRSKWKGEEADFRSYLKSKAEIEIKDIKLTSRTKVNYNIDDEGLESIYNKLDQFTFLNPDELNKVRGMIEVVRSYRSLAHECPNLCSIVRNVRNDDRNFPRVQINLRINGTDTGRFSSSKGKGVNRVNVLYSGKRRKMKATYLVGDGVCTQINSQGLSKNDTKTVRAKRLTAVPEVLRGLMAGLDTRVRAYYVDRLLGVK